MTSILQYYYQPQIVEHLLKIASGEEDRTRTIYWLFKGIVRAGMEPSTICNILSPFEVELSLISRNLFEEIGEVIPPLLGHVFSRFFHINKVTRRKDLGYYNPIIPDTSIIRLDERYFLSCSDDQIVTWPGFLVSRSRTLVIMLLDIPSANTSIQVNLNNVTIIVEIPDNVMPLYVFFNSEIVEKFGILFQLLVSRSSETRNFLTTSVSMKDLLEMLHLIDYLDVHLN